MSNGSSMAQTARIPTGELKLAHSRSSFLRCPGGTNGQNSNRGIETHGRLGARLLRNLAQTARIPTGELKRSIRDDHCALPECTNGQNSNRGIETRCSQCRVGDHPGRTNGQNSNRGIETSRMRCWRIIRYSTNGQNSNRGIETQMNRSTSARKTGHKRPEFQPGN